MFMQLMFRRSGNFGEEILKNMLKEYRRLISYPLNLKDYWQRNFERDFYFIKVYLSVYPLF